MAFGVVRDPHFIVPESGLSMGSSISVDRTLGRATDGILGSKFLKKASEERHSGLPVRSVPPRRPSRPPRVSFSVVSAVGREYGLAWCGGVSGA